MVYHRSPPIRHTVLFECLLCVCGWCDVSVMSTPRIFCLLCVVYDWNKAFTRWTRAENGLSRIHTPLTLGTQDTPIGTHTHSSPHTILLKHMWDEGTGYLSPRKGSYDGLVFHIIQEKHTCVRSTACHLTKVQRVQGVQDCEGVSRVCMWVYVFPPLFL